MTFYFSTEAEMYMMSGMLFFYDYRVLIRDLIAAFLGYMAWRNYKDFNSTEIEPWTNAQLKYEIVYYVHRTYLDYNKWKCVHHVLSLGLLYWAWAFQTALSTTFFFASISNCFMALMQKHPNKITKFSFAVSFFIARIVYGQWIMYRLIRLPVRGSERIIMPMLWVLYVMQWWWFHQIVRHVKRVFKVVEGSSVNGSSVEARG
jgi:hypothetical protein